MQRTPLSQYFSGSYAQARQQFADAALQRGLQVESHVMQDHRGALDEVLATDVLRIGAADATRLLIVSSGTHGPEGFCGSGVQVAMLDDADLLSRADKAGVALLLVHAVNPYGFSWLQRTNEDNIDLNRNCLDFTAPLPVNPHYAQIERLMLPPAWPPTPDNEQAIAAFIQQHGVRVFREAVSSGQSVSPDGLFYAGKAPAWSNRTLRGILQRHAVSATDIAWVDIHTGLGPYGHGEKIYAGRNDAAELARARAIWGPDVFAYFDGQSVSAQVRGPLAGAVFEECPAARTSLMGLEFGTLPEAQVMLSLRASAWARSQPALGQAQRASIRRQVRDAFYCDCDEWKGMVVGQSRTIALQAIVGLGKLS
jgi:hypothetical protein